jgi:hypothetical protein
MTVTRRSLWPLLAWMTGLGVAIAAFSAMGTDSLAAPTLTEPGAWGGWAADRDPVVALVALLRLVVLALAWYLLLTTLLGIAGRCSRSPAAVRAADAISPQVVRRVLRTSLGAGLAAAVAVTTVGPARLDHATLVATAAEAPPPSSDAPRMRPLPPRPTADAPARVPASAPQPARTSPAPLPGEDTTAVMPAPPTMTPEPPVVATPTPAAPTPPSAPRTDSTDPARTPTHGVPTPTTPDTMTVEVGDHLWAIAEAEVRQHVAAPTDRHVARHWRRVVAANRDRLVDPANPDLILPGQQVVLPPVEGEVS